MTAKMGRPTDNPKTKKIAARLDAESTAILENYCQQEQVSESECVRRGIKKLKAELKK